MQPYFLGKRSVPFLKVKSIRLAEQAKLLSTAAVFPEIPHLNIAIIVDHIYSYVWEKCPAKSQQSKLS